MPLIAGATQLKPRDLLKIYIVEMEIDLSSRCSQTASCSPFILKYNPCSCQAAISLLSVSEKKKRGKECPSDLLQSHDTFATAGHQDSELKTFTVFV